MLCLKKSASKNCFSILAPIAALWNEVEQKDLAESGTGIYSKP